MRDHIPVRRPSTDAEWKGYFELRWLTLRAPWNQPRGSERDDLDDRADGVEHAMITDDSDAVLAVGRLHLNDPREAQVRFMAVASYARGLGLGRRVLEYLEHQARSLGAETIVLNSRDSAVGFYAKLGYQTIADAPALFGAIPHVKMQKSLLAPSP